MSTKYEYTTSKYQIMVRYDKMMRRLFVPNTKISCIISILRKIIQVKNNQTIYLYLQQTNKLINAQSRVSQLVKEIQDRRKKQQNIHNNKQKQHNTNYKTNNKQFLQLHQSTTSTNSQEDQNIIIKLRMDVQQTF